MKIQLLSDLHIEFNHYDYVQHCQCDADVVVLAGDIHLGLQAINWIADQIPTKPVLYVLGNHEYYGQTYPSLIDQLKAHAQQHNQRSGSQIHILENDRITFKDVNFFGCTLWTDFTLFGDPRIGGFHCEQVMNDYRRIKKQSEQNNSIGKIRAVDTATIHATSLKWLAEQLNKHQQQKNVVISHHAPTMLCAPAHRRSQITTAGYVSELSRFIDHYQPQYWLHGHLHSSTDQLIGACRVLSNPKGYNDHDNPHYNPRLCFEI